MIWGRATHTQQQTLVLLDGTKAPQETCHHDDGAQDDDEVGGGERGEGGRQGGEAALGDRQPNPDAQQTAAAQLEHTQKKNPPVDVTMTKGFDWSEQNLPRRRG